MLQVADNFLSLIADAGPWFLGGAILGAMLEAYLSAAWVLRWLGSQRASVFNAAIAGAVLPGCSMTTVPLAAALKKQGARLGTLTAFIMISPILSPETITLTAAMLGWKFTLARIIIPVVATLLMGLTLNALEAHGISRFQLPGAELKTAELKSDCCAESELCAGKPKFWRSFVALLHPLWLYFTVGLLAVAILQTVVSPQSIGKYLHGGFIAYVLAALVGIPMYVCEGAEVPLTYGLLKAGVAFARGGRDLSWFCAPPGSTDLRRAVDNRRNSRRRSLTNLSC